MYVTDGIDLLSVIYDAAKKYGYASGGAAYIYPTR